MIYRHSHQPCRLFNLLWTLLLVGFLSVPAAAQPSAEAATAEIRQLAVMPFISVDSGSRQAKELTMTLDCELQGLCDIDRDILTHQERHMTEQLHEALIEHYADAVLPQSEITKRYLRLTKQPKETPRELAVRFGQQIEADHVMVGLLWHYRQRIGGAWSADSPAAVAFSLFLVDVANQKLIWEGQFDKTQQALSDNLLDASLFFTSGVKWLTVEELASYGLEKTLEKLPRH